MNNRRWLWLIVVVLLAGTLACGSEKSTPLTPATPVPTTAAPEVATPRPTKTPTQATAEPPAAATPKPFQAPADVLRPLTSPALALWLLILGLIPTLGGGIAFNAGLHHIPASNASIIATLEPVIAAALGWAVWGERLDAPQLLGAGLILAAVVILQRPSRTSH